MQSLRRVALVTIMLFACVGCDQTTKSLARDHLLGRGPLSFFNDTVRLQYVENPGAFLSVGSSLPHAWRTAVFTVGAGGVLTGVFLFAALARKCGPWQIAALSLVCGGGVGNLLDRVRYDGHVTDFLSMGLGPLRTGIFNVADVALMAGMALLIISTRSLRP
jgi:signal peptidase II